MFNPTCRASEPESIPEGRNREQVHTGPHPGAGLTQMKLLDPADARHQKGLNM